MQTSVGLGAMYAVYCLRLGGMCMIFQDSGLSLRPNVFLSFPGRLQQF